MPRDFTRRPCVRAYECTSHLPDERHTFIHEGLRLYNRNFRRIAFYCVSPLAFVCADLLATRDAVYSEYLYKIAAAFHSTETPCPFQEQEPNPATSDCVLEGVSERRDITSNSLFFWIV